MKTFITDQSNEAKQRLSMAKNIMPFRRWRLGLLPALVAVLCFANNGQAAVLSNGSLTLTVRDDNGAIGDVVLGSTNFFSHGSFVSDFGLQSGTDTSSFRVNTTNGGASLALDSWTSTPTSFTAFGTYTVGMNVAYERAYSLVPGQNSVLITTRFVNLGGTTASLRYFETYDPDQGFPNFETVNDVYTVAGTPAARATAPGGSTFIIGGSSPSQTLASGGPFSIDSGAALNAFFSSPVDGNSTSADQGTHLGNQFSLPASEEITLTHILAFGDTLAAAETAFTESLDLTSPGSFRAGINANGGLGIENLSETGISINTITITLINDTFFDTTTTAPGTAPTGWSQQAAIGGVTAALPSNASTDGQSMATISFSSFDAADAINLGFDLDLFASPDGAGNPLGATVTALFSDGGTASVTLALENLTINGFSYAYSGTSSSIPEPATCLLLGLGIAAVLLRRRPVRYGKSIPMC